MKSTAILTAALLCVLSPISFAKPMKVFILAGQSNMEGQGSVDHEGDRKDGKGNLVWSMTNSKSAGKMKCLKNEQGAGRRNQADQKCAVHQDHRFCTPGGTFAQSLTRAPLVRQCRKLLSHWQCSGRGYEEPVEVILLHCVSLYSAFSLLPPFLDQ